jgi:pterin-4a-carbinolamine dehydratase
MCIKLEKLQRWLPAKNFLAASYGIAVHFSDRHANYYTAWSYVTKEDECSEESEVHPDLKTFNRPATMNAHVAMCRSRRAKVRENVEECEDSDEDCIEGEEISGNCKPKKGKKRKRLSAFEFSQIIVEKGLKNRTDALAFAQIQKDEGKPNLAEFIVNRGVKTVNEVIATAWEMEGANLKKQRMAKSRLEILEEAANES